MTELPTPTTEQIQAAQAIISRRIQETSAQVVSRMAMRSKPLLDVYLVADSFLDGRATREQLEQAVRQARADLARSAAGIEA